MKSLSCVQLLATPWTAAYRAPPSMGFSRQEYWSGVPLPSPYPFLEAGKGEGVDSSLAPPGGTGQAGTILAQGDHSPISDLQNCNVTNLCCFKS